MSRAASTQRISRRRPTDANIDVDGDDEADLPDLDCVAGEDNVNTELMGVDTNIDGGDEADLLDLVWIAREDNAYPPEYYLD
jgi:hypothetical protein